MADIISQDRKPVPRVPIAAPVDATPQPALSETPLALVEMLFFAYRDFTGEADVKLAAYDLGRAHHRVLHFVNRCPGIRVAHLLEVLKITKQSLGRVLRKLIEDQWIEQAPGADDRRERLLTLTDRGRVLAAELADLQIRRIDEALRESAALSGVDAADIIRNFLFAMIAPSERAAVQDIVMQAGDLTEPAVRPDTAKVP